MEVTFYGALGIIVLLLMLALAVMLIWVSIFGGYVTYESEGLIPKIKRWRQQKGG